MLPHNFIPLIDRLQLGENGCWNWRGAKSSAGYGQTYYKGKKIYAHRLSAILWLGFDNGSLQVLHRCDNPNCWNPKHLFIGTQLDNIRDCRAKGRNRHFIPLAQCKNGHLYGGTNLHQVGGRRFCRECHRVNSLKYVRRKKGELIDEKEIRIRKFSRHIVSSGGVCI